MRSVSGGARAEIVDALKERRARYCVAYYVVSDRQLDRVGPLVARLVGAVVAAARPDSATLSPARQFVASRIGTSPDPCGSES